MKASNVLTSALCLVGSVWLVLSLNGCAEVVDTSSTTSTLTPATTTTSVTGTTTSTTTTTTLPKAAAPVFTLAAGDYDTTEATVTIVPGSGGADNIYYTLDGTPPTTASALYAAPFKITVSRNVKAIAAKSGYSNSDVASAQYDLWWWEALGSEISDNVQALAIGSLYAGGINMGTVGGVANTYLAKWNGSSWTSLCNNGNDMGQTVNALAFDAAGNHLYVGFNSGATVTGESNTYLARWDGNSWAALCYLANQMDSAVNALALDASGNLYAGFGSQVSVEGETGTYIAKWNGSAWSSIGNASNNMDYAVLSLVVDKTGDLYAGLSSGTSLEGKANTYLAKWNGSAWSSIGNQANGMWYAINAMTVDSANNLYAGMDGNGTVGGVADTYLGRWNGSAWTSVGNGGNGIDNNVQALAIDSAGRLYAGGSAFDAGTNNYLKRLNGSSWEAFGGGIDSYIKVLKIDGSDDLFIGGEFSTGNFPAMPGTKYIAKWGKR